ncbi:MAG: asparaginase [Pseudomonadota bacterium]
MTSALDIEAVEGNPVLVELTRGGIVESRHRGAFCIAHADGSVMLNGGHCQEAVFPRSSIKAFQALAVMESGAFDHFGFSDEQIALACASHGGQARHTKTALAMLQRAEVTEADLECGGHWPTYQRRTNEMIAAGERPGPVHNNCSGKHAGMLALARKLGVETAGYVREEHAVQQAMRRTIEELCERDLSQAAVGIDGCSVPTWAVPLDDLARAFARFGGRRTGSVIRDEGCARILAAVRAHPFMVAGTGRFCTDVMAAIPRLFVKTGAEGVFCGCVPSLGIGFALKCEDGATRASEAATAGLLLCLDTWGPAEQEILNSLARQSLLNRNRLEIGEIRPSSFLKGLNGNISAAI